MTAYLNKDIDSMHNYWSKAVVLVYCFNNKYLYTQNKTVKLRQPIAYKAGIPAE